MNARRAIINDKPAQMMLDIRVPPGGKEIAERELLGIAKKENVILKIVEFQ